MVFKNGYRLYIGDDDRLHFDWIVDGVITPLLPEPGDEALELGMYDADMNYLGTEIQVGWETEKAA